MSQLLKTKKYVDDADDDADCPSLTPQ